MEDLILSSTHNTHSPHTTTTLPHLTLHLLLKSLYPLVIHKWVVSSVHYILTTLRVSKKNCVRKM